jgi:hypothetical protein
MLPYVCKYRVIIGNVLSFCMFVEYRIFTDSRLSVLLNVIYVLKGRLRAEFEPTSDSRVPLLINFWIHVTVFALLRMSKFILFSSSKLEWLWSEVVVTCIVLLFIDNSKKSIAGNTFIGYRTCPKLISF